MEMNEAQMTEVLAAQRAAFLRDGAPPVRERKLALTKLKQALLRRREALAQAASADFGYRSTYETAILDLAPTVRCLHYLSRNVERWMAPRPRQVAAHLLPASAKVVYQPLGVVGIVSPWNYPISLTMIPLATAIAAGNRAMLKPSELTPRTNAVLMEMLAEIFDGEQVAVIAGGAEAGAAFSRLPFDYLLFTGSTGVGRSVMRVASESLVPVTLELGGKSPAMVERGFAEKAAASIAYGKLANAGQTCIAPDYALIHEGEIAAFVEAYTLAARRYYPRGVKDDGYTSIISARHYERLLGLIEDARAKGARVVQTGAWDGSEGTRERTLSPTLILGATEEMKVLEEEIFGPILPVLEYRTLDEAIGYVNARPRPLALYYFGRPGEACDRVLAKTTSGNVTINDTLLHYAVEDLPFGGVGASGMGAYHGEEGFRAFSHVKGVFRQSRWSGVGLTRAPFGRAADAALRWLLR
jgi:coniferyl-aldehyde dehydrogenase